MTINFIVKVDQSWNIGVSKTNSMPWESTTNPDIIQANKEDMDYFKRLRTSWEENVVLMWRKTWQSIDPKFRPLTQATNIVLTRTEIQEIHPDLRVYDDPEKSLEYIKKFFPDSQVWIIGWWQIFKWFLEHKKVDQIFLTRLHEKYEDADIKMPWLKINWKNFEFEGFELESKKTIGMQDYFVYRKI